MLYLQSCIYHGMVLNKTQGHTFIIVVTYEIESKSHGNLTYEQVIQVISSSRDLKLTVYMNILCPSYLPQPCFKYRDKSVVISRYNSVASVVGPSTLLGTECQLRTLVP